MGRTVRIDVRLGEERTLVMKIKGTENHDNLAWTKEKLSRWEDQGTNRSHRIGLKKNLTGKDITKSV